MASGPSFHIFCLRIRTRILFDTKHIIEIIHLVRLDLNNIYILHNNNGHKCDYRWMRGCSCVIAEEREMMGMVGVGEA